MYWQEWCYLCIVILLETKARELGTWDAQVAKFCLVREVQLGISDFSDISSSAHENHFLYLERSNMRAYNKIWSVTIYHLDDHVTSRMIKESPSENEHRIEKSTYYVVPEITMLARPSSRESPDTRKRTRQASSLLVNQYFTSEFHRRPSSSLIALRTRGLPRHDRKIDYARPVLARWR